MRRKEKTSLLKRIASLENEIRLLTPRYRESPKCYSHGMAIATRQQVKGGAYVWLDYCDWTRRTECWIVGR